MKPALQLNIGQQLTLTPQLQQAIRLLQLSNLDLNQEIQELLDSNSMLEVDEEQQHADNQQTNSKDELLADKNSWDEHIPTVSTRRSHAPDGSEYERQHAHVLSLQDHLRWQVSLASLSDVDATIATALIDAINQQGLLTCALDEIQASLRLEHDDVVDLEEIEAVLCMIQHLDPIGIGARDLRECLLLQLQQLPADTPWYAQAHDLLSNHFELLSKRDYNQLLRATKHPRQDLEQIIGLIQSLNPRPGNHIDNIETQYVIPDILVSRDKGQWRIELNDESLPKIRINQNYSSLAQGHQRNDDGKFLRSQLQEARWFIKSLQSRNETLYKVASYIFNFQRDFLEHGPAAMKPLVLNQVAEAVGMHESTISRVTTQKFAETPHGIYELKYFFSSHISKEDGKEYSSTAIRTLLKDLIAKENPQKPLSDSKLTTLLAEQGIPIARRTVAKYRESLQIPPSNERKSLI